MQDFSTPMMKQYMEIKKKYPGCLLFFRMGDFYELFMEDAHTGSQILNITLTGKAGGKDGRIPMAGVPYHSVDAYIAKLVHAGHKVAICEQLSPPNKKGLVKRDVVRVVTPGTLLDEKNLEKKEHNYIIAIALTENSVTLSVADISTGYFALGETGLSELIPFIRSELARLKPSECILPDELYNDTHFLELLTEQKNMNIFPSHLFASLERSHKTLIKHFGTTTLQGFGLSDTSDAAIAGAALLTYLQSTQQDSLSHFKKVHALKDESTLLLDRSTIINLELFATIRESDPKRSLLATIDETITAMGGRMLKTWVRSPLNNKEKIEERLDTVEYFSENPAVRDLIREQLTLIPDIERLTARLSVNLGNARDICNLSRAITTILVIRETLTQADTALLKTTRSELNPTLLKLSELIKNVFVDEPPLSVRDGKMIKSGVNERLDSLRTAVASSTSWLSEFEKREKATTGISTLKVRYNKVFGYYIEISKSHTARAPIHYERKQTLVNGERFITEELKKHEEIILTAEEKINDIEYKIFLSTLENILTHIEEVQKAAESIAIIDCLSSFSRVADRHRYSKPKLLYSGEIRIKQGRHPVVERLLDMKQFVPNDTVLDNVSQPMLLITGPNMAGKSVFIRQVALIVLMAHIGSFVPAASAHISIVDKIFVRSGASDIITSGLSTFMVEMVETAHILNTASSHSLIVMDEIGRGTSTYDGISIAWAVAEYLVTHYETPPKVLFATHYHELQSLEDEYPNKIKNVHMAVTEQKGNPIFLHTLLPGGASHSFGVAVAKLAGVPEEVIFQASSLLKKLETRSVTDIASEQENPSIVPDELLKHFVQRELQAIDIATMTPLEALNILASLKEKAVLFSTSSQKMLEKD